MESPETTHQCVSEEELAQEPGFGEFPTADEVAGVAQLFAAMLYGGGVHAGIYNLPATFEEMYVQLDELAQHIELPDDIGDDDAYHRASRLWEVAEGVATRTAARRIWDEGETALMHWARRVRTFRYAVRCAKDAGQRRILQSELDDALEQLQIAQTMCDRRNAR